MIAPGAVVGDIDALFALGVGADEGAVGVDDSLVKLDFNSTNTSPCRDMTYVVFPDRRKSLATKNLRRLVPRIGRNSLLGNRLR